MAGLIHRVGARAGGASYDILIGNSFLPESFRRSEIVSPERIALVVSKKAYELHRPYLDEALNEVKNKVFLMHMDDREENKSYGYAEGFLKHFIEAKLNRKSMVIGVGGGVTGDFSGFCAGLFMRGIPIVHVPTTLLAMVDSSIGGKVAVNLSVGKNLAGLFHQPALVISDVRFLRSLPDAEFRNGLAESFKHGLLGDEPTLELLERHGPESIKSDEAIADLVALSAAFKARIVERDERETGLRSVLNFGHTIGHALESSVSYRGVSHGQAVAAGIKIKIEVSRRMGLLTDNEAGRADAIMKRHGLLPELKNFDLDRVIEHMDFDKKNFGGAINFVLLEGIGNPRINQRISPETLRRVMVEIC